MPALTVHRSAAPTTEQLRCQQVQILCLSPGRGFLVFGFQLLYPVKQVFGNNGGNTVRHHNVTVFILPDVLAVAENPVQGVQSNFVAVNTPDFSPVQIIHNFLHCLALVIHLVDFQHNGCRHGIWHIALLLIHHQPKCNRTSIAFAFQRIFRMSTDDFLRQVCGVVFRHALQHRFQYNPLRAV